MTTRVVLIDDHELIRGGLRRAFEDTGEFTVVAECRTLSEGRTTLASDPPEVVVVDIGLPDGDGLDLVRELRKANARLGIVVLTMYADDAHLFAALDAGASAFVPKSDPSDKVIAAARHASAAPEAFSAPDLGAALQRRLRPEGIRLTDREREVLDLLGDGLTTSSIARRLFVSESTAKGHIAKLFEKLEATNRTQAVMNAVRMGLLSNDRAG